MSKRVNDGDRTGLKQDRFRNSNFEYDEDNHREFSGGASKKTLNVLGGPFQDNRGRRYSSPVRSHWDGSPFEDGELSSWKNRRGWDDYYRPYDRGNRFYGDNQLDHEGSHFGKGPKGYVRPDKSIFEDVCEALNLSPHVDASDVEVEVKDRIVYLRGQVDSRQAKRMAELEIEHISGVRDVQNYLSVGRSPELH